MRKLVKLQDALGHWRTKIATNSREWEERNRALRWAGSHIQSHTHIYDKNVQFSLQYMYKKSGRSRSGGGRGSHTQSRTYITIRYGTVFIQYVYYNSGRSDTGRSGGKAAD